MKKALFHLIHCCEEGPTLECPIIEALDGPEGDLGSHGRGREGVHGTLESSHLALSS